MSSDIFGHVKQTHTDLAKPAKHGATTDRIGWAFDPELMRPDVNGKKHDPLDHEMNDTLTILTPEERFLLSVDNTLAYAYNDLVSIDYNERFARSSIAVKGQGRKDAKDVVGGVKQTVSVPTTMQKVRKVFTGRGGKQEQERTEVEYSDGPS